MRGGMIDLETSGAGKTNATALAEAGAQISTQRQQR